MSSTNMLSGYVPLHVDYTPAKVGDAAVHAIAQQAQSERGPASQVALSPAAMQAMKALHQK